jgi:predicted dehydrogenase
MKVVIVGYGVQGKKRKLYLKKTEFICFVDPYLKDSNYRLIEDVPKHLYDTVFICTPDNAKLKIIEYCIKNKKNCLIEKPFPFCDLKRIKYLEKLSNKNKVICYIAYNHRFEPFIHKIDNFLKSNKIGKIYSCKLFYGNGTSKLVKNSSWKDKGLGVVVDLSPHLMDMCRTWFGIKTQKFLNIFVDRFENKSPDYATINSKIKNIKFELSMTYCMWKNDFFCDIIGEKGSIHMSSLCKWDRTFLKIRSRKFPSGKPKEKIFTMKSKDPTWNYELINFKKLINLKEKNNFNRDIWINENLKNFKKLLKIK